jgi:alanine-synthesizing transaminase
MFSQRTNWRLSPNRFSIALEELRAAGGALIDLTISNPTHCGFAYDEEAILRGFQNPKMLSYNPQSKGLLSAREEVTRYYRDDHCAKVDAESTLLTTSTSEAYSFVFRLLCNPGDEVLVPKPSYPLFDFLADIQDVVLKPYALEYAQGWFLDVASLVETATDATRAILLVHPNNPTGSFLKANDLARLNQICIERDIALIVDEVFLDYAFDYAFDGARHKTFADNQDALTFTLSGLSKIAALPQMKMAWIVVSGPETPRRSALERLEVIADTYLSVSTPTQLALPVLFEERREMQTQVLARIRENRAELRALLAGQSACEALDGEGGWSAVLRVPVRGSDEDMAIELLREQGVVVHPGHFYDFANDGYVVLSLIGPVETFRQGVQRILKYFGGK